MLNFLIKFAALTAIALMPLTSYGAEIKVMYVTTAHTDDGGNIMRRPEGIACSEKSILVADTGNGRLLRFSYQNNALQGGVEIKAPQLQKPIRVQTNTKQEIFALDGKRLRIVRFDENGKWVGDLEPKGLPQPSSIVPKSLYLDKNDDIYVLDIFASRVLVLDSVGNYKTHVEFPKEYGFISDLFVGPQGNVYLIDSVHAVVFTASKGSKTFTPLTKKMKEQMQFPVSLDIDNGGIMYVVDRNASSIIILNQDGSYQSKALSPGRRDGFLYYPSQLCLNDTGEVFIADRDNNRIQVFSVVK